MSIRLRLLVLFLLIVSVLGIVSLYALEMFRHTMDDEHLLINSTNRSVELSHRVETLINNQLNAWKNVLLRGDSQNNYHEYLQQFYASERRARQALKALADETAADVKIGLQVSDLVMLHQQIGRRFREAIRVYNATDSNPASVTDAFMADIEILPVQKISAITNSLIQSRDQTMAEHEHSKHHHQQVLIGSLAMVVVVSLLSYLWLVDRHVAIPAHKASQLADVMDNAQRVAKFGTWEWDTGSDQHFWSAGLYQILGIDPEENPGRRLLLCNLHEEDRARVDQSITDALTDQTAFELEARLSVDGRGERVFQMRGDVSNDGRNAQPRLTVIVYDITERIESEKRLAQLANYDTLTSLPNRNLFQDRLRHAMAKADRSGSKIALLYLDLDHFKAVNDALGHQTGDELLKEAAIRIRQHIREGDTAARLGGDEFTIVLEEFQNNEQIITVAKHVLEALNAIYHIGSNEIFVSASIGITLFPDDGRDVETLLQNADSAMYLAKDEGRNTYHFYTEELNRLANETLRLENSLRMALQRDEFQLFFQPQVELISGRIIGAEALLRWMPSQNPVSPERFIPILEETGLIVPVGNWVLAQACKVVKDWHQQGFPGLRVAVNLASRQLRQAEIADVIEKQLKAMDLAPGFLEIELTESTLIDESFGKSNLKRLEKLGVTLSIDDFGTGYSSLSYLKQYAVDVLKIDRSFISDIMLDQDDDAVTSAIIALAHKLDMQVVAEGIENAEQWEYLVNSECDIGQGFYIARPMDVVKFRQWLASHRTADGSLKWLHNAAEA